MGAAMTRPIAPSTTSIARFTITRPNPLPNRPRVAPGADRGSCASASARYPASTAARETVAGEGRADERLHGGISVARARHHRRPVGGSCVRRPRRHLAGGDPTRRGRDGRDVPGHPRGDAGSARAHACRPDCPPGHLRPVEIRPRAARPAARAERRDRQHPGLHPAGFHDRAGPALAAQGARAGRSGGAAVPDRGDPAGGDAARAGLPERRRRRQPDRPGHRPRRGGRILNGCGARGRGPSRRSPRASSHAPGRRCRGRPARTGGRPACR